MGHSIKERVLKLKERTLLGLHRPIDEHEESRSARYIADNFARLIIEFKNFGEYIQALDEADILITCDEKVPEPLRSNLISANNRIMEDEKSK